MESIDINHNQWPLRPAEDNFWVVSLYSVAEIQAALTSNSMAELFDCIAMRIVYVNSKGGWKLHHNGIERDANCKNSMNIQQIEPKLVNVYPKSVLSITFCMLNTVLG